jgi:hypothetical protein
MALRSKRTAFRATDVVRATLEETFAWWTDPREDDAGNVMPPLRRRRIVRRTASEIETEDRWSIFGIPLRKRAILRPMPPNQWEVASYFRGGSYRDVVRLEPASRGTRVTMELAMVEMRWPWSWALRLLRAPLGRLLQRDLEAVDRALESSLRPR